MGAVLCAVPHGLLPLLQVPRDLMPIHCAGVERLGEVAREDVHGCL